MAKKKNSTLPVNDLAALANLNDSGEIPARYFFYLFADEKSDDDKLVGEYLAMEDLLMKSPFSDLFNINSESKQVVLEEGNYVERVYRGIAESGEGFVRRRGFPITRGRINEKALEKDDLYARICRLI